MAKIQSVEPNVADLANGWLKSYKLDYKLEQESLNTEIDQALNDYYSKNGGVGGNRPDAKLLLQDKNLGNYPILIEYKGYKDKLVKLDVDGKVANKTSKNQPDFKNINSYAVNGAVHYANALLHYTSYTDIIAIGMTGYKNDAGKLEYEIGVYYVSKSNFGIGQKVDEYTDFSFLKKSNFDGFIEKVKRLQLSQEDIEKLREHREQEINASLVKLNNDIYNNEKGLSERDRVYLVAASIIATLGVPGKVAALEKSELKSSTEEGNRDGDIILRKIKAFLSEKNLPQEKRDLIVRTLQNTLTTDNINKVENGESQLKRVFTKIIDDLGIYYKIGLSTDFTGKLFNEMYSWLGFSQDKLNDVVLTPSYVATLLARLARVNKDSYVWDFATGSAGLLVAAMNEMLIDAKEQIKSPDEFALKSAQIKANQLLGLEILSEVYIVFDKAKWINHPVNTYRAENKLYQLQCAQNVGLPTPKTFVGNILPKRITPTNKYIVKSLDTALFYDESQEYFTYSSVVSGNELAESNIKDAPVILQEFLEDKRDIRVTVIGDKLFPVGITKNGENIYGDWRKNAKEDLQYMPETLPDDISNSIIKLMNTLELTFGGVDLAFSDGQYYFIEVNPTGEWGWLNQYCAIPLEKVIVDELVGEE